MYIKTQRKRRHGGPLRKTQTLPPVNTLGSNVGVTHTYFFSEINRATHITFIQKYIEIVVRRKVNVLHTRQKGENKRFIHLPTKSARCLQTGPVAR